MYESAPLSSVSRTSFNFGHLYLESLQDSLLTKCHNDTKENKCSWYGINTT